MHACGQCGEGRTTLKQRLPSKDLDNSIRCRPTRRMMIGHHVHRLPDINGLITSATQLVRCLASFRTEPESTSASSSPSLSLGLSTLVLSAHSHTCSCHPFYFSRANSNAQRVTLYTATLGQPHNVLATLPAVCSVRRLSPFPSQLTSSYFTSASPDSVW